MLQEKKKKRRDFWKLAVELKPCVKAVPKTFLSICFKNFAMLHLSHCIQLKKQKCLKNFHHGKHSKLF